MNDLTKKINNYNKWLFVSAYILYNLDYII
jgi:hypothetical protein